MRSMIMAALFLGWLGCEENEQYLSPEAFTAVYLDMIQESMSVERPDSVHLMQRSLDKFDVDTLLYKESLAYYQQNPELWLTIFDDIRDSLQVWQESAKDTAQQKKKKKPVSP